MNKTTTTTLSHIGLILIVTHFMCACGKKTNQPQAEGASPSHAQAENAFKQQLASCLLLKSSTSEFIPSNATHGVIKLQADLELTEDLFEAEDKTLITDNYGSQLRSGQPQTINNLVSKCQNKQLTIPDAKIKDCEKAEADLQQALHSTTRTVLTKATPKATKFNYDGKANASLEMGEWKIARFNGTSVNFTGMPRSTFPANALLESDPQISKLKSDYEALVKTCDQARTDLIQELEKALQTHEDSIMNPVKNALKIGNTWSDYAIYDGKKVPLKWTVVKINITGSADEPKAGSVTFAVTSGELTALFTGDVFRQNNGDLSMIVKLGERPNIPKDAPELILIIFNPMNANGLLLREGLLKKDSFWTFEAKCSS